MTVHLEDIVSGDGAERRVDNHKLVVFLGQLSEQLSGLDNRLSTHMVAEEAHQTKIKELIDLLTGFKGFLKFTRWISIFMATLWAFWMWVKDHFKW